MALCGYVIVTQELDFLRSLTLLLLLLTPALILFYKGFRSVMDMIERFGLQLDALGNEEFNSWHLANYRQGRVGELKGDFQRLVSKLANKRQEYLHNEGFLLEFIQELNLPILVMDHHCQVYFATHSFYQHTATGHSVTGASAKDLGLIRQNSQWHHLPSSLIRQRFEVMGHKFKRHGRDYHLLVFLSIEQQLRENEKQVWQKLIRVLNHEVRNSLTPIYSMSQSLLEMKKDGANGGDNKGSNIPMEQQILSVIEQRARHLLEFVDSYSAFNKLTPPRKQPTSIREVCEHLQTLYSTLNLVFKQDLLIDVDVGQLQQALINLLKNAFESGSEPDEVTCRVRLHRGRVIIDISDRGQGIANPENLFVPFYSTKTQGAGIGLVLSRELIRNQGGELRLYNNTKTPGVTAEVTLSLYETETQV